MRDRHAPNRDAWRAVTDCHGSTGWGGCYLKCYQKRDLLWFLRNMLVRLRLLLPAIVGLSQGHTGALRIANPPSRVRIPAAPLIALARIGPQDFV
jgi:hypothetical protein